MRRSLSVLLAACVVFAAALGVVIARGRLAAPTTSHNEQYRMARYLLHGNGMVCPVGPERDDPSSWYSPGYIALMAGVMGLFGEDSPLSLAAIRLLNLLALGVSAGLYFMIARRLLGARAAWLAVALMALSPALLSRADEIWDTFWFMLVGAALMATFVLAPPRIPIRIFGAGLACGVGAMINPGFTLCYPVWVLYAWWRRRPPGRQVPDLLRYVGLVLAGFVLAIIPWTVRNYRAFGELFYIRGNLPMEIWVGNAPWSDGYFFAADGRRVHPVFDAAEAERMVRLGEWGYFRACREDVVRWWGEDPGRFVRLGTRRVGWFWFGRHEWGESAPRAAMRAAGTAVPGALALLGAVIVLARRRAATVLVLTAMVFPLTYYATIVMVRYRLPIEPLLLVLSAAAIVEAGRFVGGRLRRKAPAGGPTRGDE